MEKAFLLHTKKYRESSLLVYFFTREYGKVSCVAKGAKRQRSAWLGALQPFSPLAINWVGKGELHTLTRAEITGSGVNFVGSSVFLGYYVNELLIKSLANEDPHPELFDCYENFLESCGTAAIKDLEVSVRFFEKKLLEELGYNCSFISDIDGNDIEPNMNYAFIPDQGMILAKNDGPHVYNGEDIVKFAANIIDASNLNTVKRLMRTILVSIVGKDFDTRKVYAEVMGFAQ